MIRRLFNEYFSLPPEIQFMMAFQYAVYITIPTYYFYLSLPNPLFDSNNGVFHGSYVHPISWVFVFCFILYCRYRLPVYSTKMNRIAPTSRMYPFFACLYNSLIVLLLGAFLLSITEFSWELSITYWWYMTNQLTGVNINNYVLTYGFVLTLSGIFANMMLKNYRYFRHAWVIPIALGIFQLSWLAMGFPISTRTGMLYDITANVFELTHWGMPPILFGVLLIP